MRAHGFSCSSAFPAIFLRSTIRCSSSFSSPSIAIPSSPSSSSSDHVLFIKDVAATRPPENLHYLLNMLRAKVTSRGFFAKGGNINEANISNFGKGLPAVKKSSAK